MEDRRILKEMAKILRVDIEDIPKTLERFKKEIEESKA
jgi:hypothetical protein